jgi:excisionase family DNA binding protein
LLFLIRQILVFLSVAILVLLRKGEFVIATSLLTAKDVARVLKISPALVYRLVSDGQLKAVKFNRSVRIPEEALSAFIKQNMTANQGENI